MHAGSDKSLSVYNTTNSSSDIFDFDGRITWRSKNKNLTAQLEFSSDSFAIIVRAGD